MRTTIFTFTVCITAFLTKALGQAPLHGIYHSGPALISYSGGNMLTIGSPLFSQTWCHGTITCETGPVVNDTALWLNYDKMNGQLVVTRDMERFMHVNREDVKSFTLYMRDTAYVFYRVPELGNDVFYQLISSGETCTLYKKTVTWLKRGGGASFAGPEYQDASVFYLVARGKNKFAAKLHLTKKSITKVFGFDRQKLGYYLNQHTESPLDDAFLKGLADFFNR